MHKPKIHLLCPPHMNILWNDRKQVTDAYSNKMYLLCKKLMDEGHEVAFYGIEGNNCPCTENIPYIPFEIWDRCHGSARTAEEMHNWDAGLDTYTHGRETFLKIITDNFKPNNGEVILSTFGDWASDLHNLPAPVIEWGIGYDHPFSTYKVFETYAWQHIQYGKLGNRPHYDLWGPKWYDAVIPGYIEKTQFKFQEKKDDYLLFIGRIMETKGIYIAIQLAKHLNKKLVVAGNGETDILKGHSHVEYFGCANNDEKRELYANASATLCMTQYTEPFGNVHIESMMSGTPVITTDWGVYTETVPNGMVGYRGRVWEDHVYAAENIGNINPQDCRNRAEANFTMEVVYPKFIKYFNRCSELAENGNDWYSLSKDSSYPDRFHDYWLSYNSFMKNKENVHV